MNHTRRKEFEGFDKLPNSSLLWDYSNVLGIFEKKKKKGRRAFSTVVLFLRKLAPSKYFKDLSCPSLVQSVNSTPRFVRFLRGWSLKNWAWCARKLIGEEENRILWWARTVLKRSLNETVILIVDKKKKKNNDYLFLRCTFRFRFYTFSIIYWAISSIIFIIYYYLGDGKVESEFLKKKKEKWNIITLKIIVYERRKQTMNIWDNK